MHKRNHNIAAFIPERLTVNLVKLAFVTKSMLSYIHVYFIVTIPNLLVGMLYFYLLVYIIPMEMVLISKYLCTAVFIQGK